jgi:RHS repeat-associated protein
LAAGWYSRNNCTCTKRAGTDNAALRRALRIDGGKRTLCLGAIEISHTTTGGLSAVKQYPSIQRSATGVTFTGSNYQGSLAATLTNTSTTSYLRYRPYGDQRGPGTAPNQQAFLNQVKDTPQSLTYLNQRSVDIHTGTFTTVDPLTVSTRDPYIYANANPIGLSDPSGLCASERACETAIRQCENGGGVWDGLSGTCGSKPNLTVDRLVGSKSIADTGPLTGDEKMISVAPSTTLPNSNCPDKVESGCGSVRVGLNAEDLRRVALLKEFLVRYQKNSKDLIVGAAWSSWPGSPVPLVPLPDAQVQLRADLGDYAGAAYVAVTVLEVGGKGLAGGSNGGYGGPSALSVLSLAAARSHPVASASLAGADIILATGVLGNEEDNFEYEGSVQVTLGVVAYDFDGSTLAVDVLPLQWMDVDITGLGDISVEDGVATARIQLPGLGYTEVTSGISLLLGDP